MSCFDTNQRDENQGLDSPSTHISTSSLPFRRNNREAEPGLGAEAWQLV